MKQQYAISRRHLKILMAFLVLILCALSAPFLLRFGNKLLRGFADWIFLKFLEAIS
jgi:hypothetical protein